MRKYLLLTIFSCLSFCYTIAQETATIDGIKYYLQNGAATIMVQDESLSGKITVPEYVSYNGEDYKVVNVTNGAFKNTNITEIVLSNSITSLGDECFSYCSFLNSVTLPNNITSLGNSTFTLCRSLSTITLPNSITSLGDECFINSGLRTISLPNSISTLGTSCFAGCTQLESIELSNSITSLPSLCFNGCSNLSSIKLSNNIVSIGAGCFKGCVGLTSVDLPKSLKSLDDRYRLYGSFEGCTNLMEVICHWDNLDEVYLWNDECFNGIFTEARLYVPKGTRDMYAAKEPWSNFKYIIEQGDVTEDAEKCATPTISYSDRKLLFTSQTEDAQYHYTITDDDVKTEAFSENGSVDLSATYNISVYASADGYRNSDRATATLYFVNAGLETGIDALQTEEKRGVLVSTDGGYVTVSGLDDGEIVYLYNLQGISLAEGKAYAGSVRLDTRNEKGVVILKVGNESIKVNIN